MRQFAQSLRMRTMHTLGLPAAGMAGIAGIAACAAAEHDMVMAPIAPPVVDAGIDAALTDVEAGAEGGVRHTTRALREPVNKPNCHRNVRCRAPDEEDQSVPFPDPFARCAPALAKDKRDVTFSPKETKTARVNEPDVCCYVEFHDCSNRVIQVMEGRALRANGHVQRPTSGPRPRTARDGTSYELRHRKRPHVPANREEARALAAKWTRAAENEHASIATFARLVLELLALGAPMELVILCQRAGADEVRHAEDAYALASAFAGHELAARPFPEACAPIVPDVLRLACETLLDGCIGESAAALTAARDAALARDPAVKAALRRVARDESSHAVLAFMLLSWTLQVGGLETRDAVRRQLDELVQATTKNGDDEPLSLALLTVTAPIVAMLASITGPTAASGVRYSGAESVVGRLVAP